MLIQDIIPPQQVVVLRAVYLQAPTKRRAATKRNANQHKHKIKVH